MPKFVVDLVFGDDRERRLSVRAAHRDYVGKLAQEGVVLLGGPYADDLGGTLVYDVADAAAARRILDADPYVTAGILAETTIREWVPIAGAWLP